MLPSIMASIAQLTRFGQAAAEATMEQASAWVHDNIASMILSVDLHVVGELAIDCRAR